MPYPAAPEIATSYTAAEQALGDGTLPGQELDVDLAAVRASITAIIEFMKTSLRSDGKLNNGSVGSDTLASSLLIGFDPPAPWATGVAYTTRSTVFQGFGFYLCMTAHTSGVFATDLVSGRWVLLADLTPPGGALIAANNLSDVPDKPTARSNMGLGSMATAVSGTGAAQFRTNLQNEAVFQPLQATLTAWGAITRAAGFDTFVAAPTSANLRALLTDETGAGALLFAGGAMGTPASIDLTNATGLPVAGLAASAVTTSAETIAANNVDTQVPTSAAVKAYVDTFPQCRAWGNINTVASSGTYSRTLTTVTVTLTSHGMTSGQYVLLDFTTGTATDGYYQITVVDANTFTVTDAASGSTSGNVTRNAWARGGFNIASLTRNVGILVVTFTTPMSDANYAVSVTSGNLNLLPSAGAGVGWVYAYATGSVSIGMADNNTDSGVNHEALNFVVYR